MEVEEDHRRKEGTGDINERIGKHVGRLIICDRGENAKSQQQYLK